MLSINGFAKIDALANNANGVISTFGELSPSSSTFAKEKSYFANSTLGDVTFVGFSCFNGSTKTIVTPTIGNEIALVLNWVYEQGKSGTLPSTKSQLITALEAEFSYLDSFNVGDLLVDTTLVLPEWVSFTNTVNVGNTYDAKVWFSNDSFVGQYPVSELIVIPPVTSVDVLFTNYGSVQSYLASRTQTQLTDAIQTASDNFPYTFLKTETFDWISGLNSTVSLPTNWTIIGYGVAGNNVDTIKQAIKDYILANSSHSELEWKVLIPSLFVSTEFIITPHWNRYSIENQTLQAGMYSSTLSPQAILDYALLTKGDYPTVHVSTATKGSFFTYKTLAFSIVGNPDNINGDYNFGLKFKDYLPIASTSTDFSRMSVKTQQWSNLINSMLPVAETMTSNSNVPLTMSRTVRGPITFVSKSLDGVLYLVATKASIPT